MPKLLQQEISDHAKLMDLKAQIETDAQSKTYHFNVIMGGTQITLTHGAKVKVPATIAKFI